MRTTLAVLCMSLLVTGAFSQPSRSARTLSLADAVNLALEQNYLVRQAQNNVDAAQSAVLSAYGSYAPTVSASGSWSRQQTDRAATTQLIGGQPFTLPASQTITNNFATNLSVGYTVFDGFSREASFARASANAVASENTAMRTRQTTVYQTESAYLNVLRTEQLVKVSEENLKRSQRQLERITESNRLGALSIADVYRQQSQVASDELNVITAQNNHNKAKADLLAIIALDVAQDYRFADPTITTELAQAELDDVLRRYEGFDVLKNRALSSRPDYIASQESYDAASWGVTAARRTYFPSVFASGGYSLSSNKISRLNDSKGLSWGVAIRWTLFDGFDTNQAIQSAKALERNAELSRLQLERTINVELKKALLDLQAAAKQYEVAQKGLVSATQDRRTAEERYNVGSGTLLDLLVANASYVNAEVNKINAAYNFIISKRNVEYVLGERSY
ncbi:MAG: TolC family protein [Ignavibacteria bacterium]|nr:TolC family protein [Ignavibacteria bacterium]